MFTNRLGLKKAEIESNEDKPDRYTMVSPSEFVNSLNLLRLVNRRVTKEGIYDQLRFIVGVTNNLAWPPLFFFD